MIESLKVTNHLGESLVMELRNPEQSGFLIAHVDGFAAPKANVNTTDMAGQDGAKFNSSKVNIRNIVLTIVLQPYAQHTVEDLRIKLYKYFPIAKRIKLEVRSENRYAYVYGYIEDNPVNIWSSRVATQISILCPDPFFYSVSAFYVPISGISPLFTFPFSNESTSEPLLELSEYIVSPLVNIPYTGDKITGVITRIHFLGDAENITLFNDTNGKQLTIDTSFITDFTPAYFVEGDEIYVSSVVGNKYVRFLRGGIYYNILNSLNTDFEWITLSAGENLIGYTAETTPENLQITIEYQKLYEGV